jgi:hypothetical protein
MEKGLAEVHFHNVRDFAFNKHRQIDDTVYGGGAGMVMMCEPLDLCISQLKAEREYDDIIYLTPDGETFNQKIANSYSLGQMVALDNKKIGRLLCHYRKAAQCHSHKRVNRFHQIWILFVQGYCMVANV